MRRLILAVALAGCHSGSTGVLLTIDGSSASLAAVAGLDFTVSGAESYHKLVALGRPFSAGGSERILYLPKIQSGGLSLAVNAVDDSAMERAHGSAQVTLVPGATVSATVQLLGEGSDLGSEPDLAERAQDLALDAAVSDAGDLLIQPASVSLRVTRSQLFTANEPVIWSIQEPNGGDIDALGRYFAPLTPGSYHVVATSTRDPSRASVATVAAQPLSLELVAGNIGGAGNVDGVGTAARFNWPVAVAGEFVSDSSNHSIRQIKSLFNNRVFTVAGSGAAGDADGVGTAAQFNGPAGLALVTDMFSVTALYIADSGNGKVKRMDLNHNVSTLAGGFTKPTDLAWDAAAQRLLVSDFGQRKIFAIDPMTRVVTPLAGSGAATATDHADGLQASFAGPVGLAIVGNELYVSDQSWDQNGITHFSLRAVALTGQHAVRTLDGPQIMAVDDSPQAEGTLAATIFDIRRITAGDMGADTFPIVLGGGTPAADGTGSQVGFTLNLYLRGGRLVDGNTIRTITPSGDSWQVTTIAGKQGPDPFTTSLDGQGSAAVFWFPGGIAVDDAGHALVREIGALRSVDLASGTVTTVPWQTGRFGLAWYQGALYVPGSNHTLDRVNPATGESTIIAGQQGVSASVDGIGTQATLSEPAYVVSDGAGVLYISEHGSNNLRRFDIASGALTTLAGSGTAGSADGIGNAASFSHPSGLTLDGRGGLYVADRGNVVIRKIDLQTRMVSRYAGGIGVEGVTDGNLDSARFMDPWSLACDGHWLYVAGFDDQGSTEPAVRIINLATGVVSHFVGAPGQQGISLGPLPATLTTMGDNMSGPPFPVSLPLALTPAGDLLIGDQRSLLIVR